MTEFLAKLKKIDEEENDPKKKEWLAQVRERQTNGGRLGVRQGHRAVRGDAKTGAPNEKPRRTWRSIWSSCTRKWEPKSEAHKEARAFIYDVWPKLDDAGLLERSRMQRRHTRSARGSATKAGLSRLFKATEAHAVRMKQELKDLRPDIETDEEAGQEHPRAEQTPGRSGP